MQTVKTVGMAFILLLAGCNTNSPLQLSESIGVYKIVEKQLVPENRDSAGSDIAIYVELSQGIFAGVAEDQMVAVIWQGVPKIDPNLTYQAHALTATGATAIPEDDTLWIEKSESDRSYLTFVKGNLLTYEISFKSPDDIWFLTRYKLKKITDDELSGVSLSYPTN